MKGTGDQAVSKGAPVTVVIDAALFALCWYLVFFLRAGEMSLGEHREIFVETLPLAVAAAVFGFLAAGSYRPARSAIDLDDFKRVARGAAYGFLGLVAATFFLQISDPRLRLVLAGYALLLPLA